MPADADRQFEDALRHHRAGRLGDAEQGYRRALETDQDHADALHMLGVIALQTGHAEPALALIERAVQLRPDAGVLRSNLGQVLERLDRSGEAEQAYREALALDPGLAEACNNLGRLLHNRDDLDAAETLYRQAIDLNADYAEPLTNLGNLRKDYGDLDGAIEAHRRAIALRPDLSLLHSNLLLTLHYHEAFPPARLAGEHAAWAARHVAPLVGTRAPHDNDPDPDRRLRIGYVSPDFRDHAVARFLLPLLRHHDRDRFEIVAYSDVIRPDAVTGELRASTARWRDCANLSDAELAALVRNDGIDVLVDLAVHSARNRLLVFARKPAPVQFTYLGYCSTTGVDAIDYRLTDRFLDPPDGADDDHYVETSVRLPHCYWCYAVPDASRARHADTARRPGGATFGCLNNFAKVTDATLGLWTGILTHAPEARLLVYARADRHRQRLTDAFAAARIRPSRLSFVGWQTFDDYLDTYRSIDVALDPYPYAGGTTTCDALWMGVPVVTLAGETAVSRAGATLLTHAGLADLVALDKRQYVRKALELLNDPARLATLRRELRPTLESSPLMDAARFAQDIESIVRRTWSGWCADKAAGG